MIDLKNYGFAPTMLTEDLTGIPARITAVHKERYELVCEFGQSFGQLKTSIYYGNGDQAFPTTGDFVLINHINNGDSQIIKTLERKSEFTRSTVGRDKAGHTNSSDVQVVAANFDYVFIMASLNCDFNIRRIERYLTLAWQSRAIPVVVLTKADLVGDYSEQIRAVQQIAIGTEVFAVSAKTGYGLDAFSEYMKPCKTIVFLGSSGVGKSSLVNALAGEDVMAVNDIRKDDSKGRHTTTHRQLIMLKSGVMIIDTPGMRELGMFDVTTGLGEAFADVEQYFGHCKFSDCKHQSEPNCSVKAAIDSGELSVERWNSYLNLKNEAKFTDDKGAYLKQKEEWFKSIAKLNKSMKKKNLF